MCTYSLKISPVAGSSTGKLFLDCWQVILACLSECAGKGGKGTGRSVRLTTARDFPPGHPKIVLLRHGLPRKLF